MSYPPKSATHSIVAALSRCEGVSRVDTRPDGSIRAHLDGGGSVQVYYASGPMRDAEPPGWYYYGEGGEHDRLTGIRQIPSIVASSIKEVESYYRIMNQLDYDEDEGYFYEYPDESNPALEGL